MRRIRSWPCTATDRAADVERCQAELRENGRVDRTASIAAAAQDRGQHQTHGSARHARRLGIPRRRQRAQERRSELLSDCRSNRAYRQTSRPHPIDMQTWSAVPDGERAGDAPLAESAGFYRAHCFVSAATSHPVRSARTARHSAVLRRAWLCGAPPAGTGIS